MNSKTKTLIVFYLTCVPLHSYITLRDGERVEPVAAQRYTNSSSRNFYPNLKNPVVLQKLARETACTTVAHQDTVFAHWALKPLSSLSLSLPCCPPLPSRLAHTHTHLHTCRVQETQSRRRMQRWMHGCMRSDRRYWGNIMQAQTCTLWSFDTYNNNTNSNNNDEL